MTAFATSVRIARPIEDVHAYLADPLNFPYWNSAVQAVRPVSGSDGDTGSTYTMERALPGGNVRNGLQVFACESPTEFGIRTISGPTPFSYCYRLSTQDAETVVRLHATVAFDGAPSLMAPVLARMVRRGVDANLALLKHALERS